MLFDADEATPGTGGEVTLLADGGVRVIDANGAALAIASLSFDHFSQP